MNEENWKTFKPLAPPEKWREEIIGAATAVRAPRNLNLLTMWNGLGAAALTACWISIGIFHLATPKSDSAWAESIAKRIPPRQPASVTLLSQRLNLNPEYYE